VSSLAHSMRSQLESKGEYVVCANLENGWFAIFRNTWERRLAQCAASGRRGPNLIVYRTRSGAERDHHLIPFSVIAPMLSTEALTRQKSGTYRWNLTLANNRLHVCNREGFVSIEGTFGARLLVESHVTVPSEIEREQISWGMRTYEDIVEGIAKECVVLSRSRSSTLRHEALRVSGGICACCGVNFSQVLNGRGLRALEVHHTKQLALRETPEATSLSDLAVVCANCHAIIHTDLKKAMKVEELRAEWAASRL
jgi:hypothetical protein